MYNNSIYLSKNMGMDIKQYVNGNIIWLFGERGIIKTKLLTRTLLQGRDNYLIFEDLLIDFIYKKFAVLNNIEKKKAKMLQVWTKQSFFKQMMSLTHGFKQYLRVRGVGYKFDLIENNVLIIDIGYSYKLQIKVPREYKLKFSRKHSKVRFYLTDLQKITLFVSKIRKLKLPDVYKGKGIRYLHDQHPQKIGKVYK